MRKTETDELTDAIENLDEMQYILQGIGETNGIPELEQASKMLVNAMEIIRGVLGGEE